MTSLNEFGRRTKDVPITEKRLERDVGQLFRITEMSAEDGEAWAFRAILALTNAGVDIGEARGMEAIAIAGMRGIAKLRYEDAKPLLDEMFKCVEIVPDPKGNIAFSRPLQPNDIKEVGTRMFLRAEVFALHVGFLKPGDLLKGSTSGTQSPGQSSGQTSHQPSQRSSRRPHRSPRAKN